jgi:cohesin loading factor subunit SCC2
VELIGKYMVEAPDVAEEYYQKIADRMAVSMRNFLHENMLIRCQDTGVGVRKRVIKLLKAYYYVTYDNVLRVDISTRLILRMLDEDDGVKELAVRTLEDLWFQNGLSMSNSSFKAPAMSNLRDNDVLQAKVAVVMGVSAHFKDRQSPLENMLYQIIADRDGEDATFLHARYAEICGVLIDGLVDASDLPGFVGVHAVFIGVPQAQEFYQTVINCVRTIYHLTSAHPAVLSDSSASILLPYLKNATTVSHSPNF